MVRRTIDKPGIGKPDQGASGIQRPAAPPRGRASHRDEMLAAALGLFAVQGVKNTSIRDITGAAGVTEAALYRHWKNKQALAEELIELAAGELTGRLKAAEEKAATPEKKLAVLIDVLFAYHAKNREKFDLVVHVAHFEPAMVNRKTALPSTVVLPVLEAGIRSKQFKNTEPKLALALIIGTVARTTQLMRMGLVKGSAAATGNQVKEMVIQALSA
jgi:AcrR family transcriptional regulator